MNNIGYEIDDKFYLLSFESGKVYCDKKSIEANTGICKQKYKLFSNKINFEVINIVMYGFFVFNSDNSALANITTFIITKNDYKERDGKYLFYDKSYIDISKPDFIDEKTVIEKCKDSQNEFNCIGILTNDCRDKLQSFQDIVIQNRHVSKKLQGVIKSCFDIESVTDSQANTILDKLLNIYKK